MRKCILKELKTVLFVVALAILLYGFNAEEIAEYTRNIFETNSSHQQINNLSEKEGSINVYFNKSALSKYAFPGNKANYHVNLEERLLIRIHHAKESIDLTVYEINLPKIVDALIDQAANGITVRIIADAKNAYGEYEERYNIMKLYIEKMIRGKDKIIGTKDDIHVLCDSPMFAEGEKKSKNAYYPPKDQMHNKFVIIDNKWIWTGSWNFTQTGLYGSKENRDQGILDGNTQNVIEIHSPKLAKIYKEEFNEMWGGSSINPNPEKSNFHARKNNHTTHKVDINGTLVEVYFSPSDNPIGKLQKFVQEKADFSVYFNIFCWSDKKLVSILKNKWETPNGQRTNFDLKGVFDSCFFYKNWSASERILAQYKNIPPIFEDNEKRKLHSKTMIIDANTNSDPSVIIGSTNWSNNGNHINDKNMLIIHNANVANQFLQEFYARYKQAGGKLPIHQKLQ